MTETRTPKQIAADKLDRQIFNLELDMVGFGVDYDEPKAREAAYIIGALRSRVRAHMHPRDREETNNG